MEFPRALYLAVSLLSLCRFPALSTHGPMSVHPSGYPWRRSHSSGVRRRKAPLVIGYVAISSRTGLWFAVRGRATIGCSWLQFSVGQTSVRFSALLCPCAITMAV